MEIITPDEGEIFDIELDEDFLRRNRELSLENRELLDSKNCRAIDVLGSVGTGKTSLIKLLVRKLKPRYRMAAVAGDLTTELDAMRIVEEGVEVMQINTGKECHLDANLLRKALEKLDLENIDLLFVENVGNLVCPAEFEIGEDFKLAILSTPEGDDKALKYPLLFHLAKVIVINKSDLLPYVDFELKKAKDSIRKNNANAKIFEVSAKTGAGFEKVYEFLKKELSVKKRI